MRSHFNWIAVGALACVGMVSGQRVLADYTAQIVGGTGASAQAGGTLTASDSDYFNSGSVNTTYLFDSISSYAEATDNPYFSSGTGSTYAAVSPGVVRISMSGYGVNTLHTHSTGGGSASAEDHDFLTISSNTLAEGTSVNYTLTSHFHFTRTVDGSSESNVANFNYGVTFEKVGGGFIWTDFVDAPDIQGEYSFQKQEVLTLLVGSTYAFNQVLNGNAYAGDGSISFDAGNTGWFSIEPVDPGDSTFTADSGGSYAALPEPASISLIAVGGTLLGMRRRTKYNLLVS